VDEDIDTTLIDRNLYSIKEELRDFLSRLNLPKQYVISGSLHLEQSEDILAVTLRV
jgi:hypothetical protein